MPTLPTFDLPELKRRMAVVQATLKHELGGLRTGRASASLLDPVQVEAYGQRMPISQVASISVPEPRAHRARFDRSPRRPTGKMVRGGQQWVP